MMNFLSRIKTWGIQVADKVTDIASPYKKLTRPWFTVGKSLSTIAQECFDDLATFWFRGKMILHRIPQGTTDIDLGDQCIWQGIYTGTLAMKYALEPSDDLKAMIENAVEGMAGHQRWVVSELGEKAPRLIRGYNEQTKAWEDDASNDSLTGHLMGIYFTYRYGPDTTRMRCVELIRDITARLIADDFKLVNADGTPTKHGKLINGAATDPLQYTLVAAILTFMERFGMDPRVPDYRHELYAKYGSLIPYPKVALGTWEKWNDEHRAAIHLAILGLEDKSPRAGDRIRRGLLRLWDLTKDRGNVWVNALIALGLGNHLPEDIRTRMREIANGVLGEYDLTKKRWNVEVVNKDRTFQNSNGETWTASTWDNKGTPRAFQPIPLWAMGSQDFVWQRHRYSVNDWKGHVTGDSQHNGMDFLAAYYLSRITGILA